jgi:hypothetical protein
MRLAVRRFSPVLMTAAGVILLFASHSVRADSKEEPSPDDKAFRLEFKFEPNQFVHYNVFHKMTVTTQKGKQKRVDVNETKSRKHYRVVYVDEQGNGTLEPVIERVQMRIRFGEDDERFWDSKFNKKPTGPFKYVARTIGKPQARIKVGRNGKPISITKVNPKSSRRSSEEAGNDLENNVLVTLPEGPVKIGETWRERYKTTVLIDEKLSLPIQMLRQYTLKSVVKNRATISLKTSVLTPVTDPKISAQLALQQSRSTGTILFDLERSMMISREVNSDERSIGFSGPDSSLHAVSVLTEQFVSPPAVARKPDETNGQ